MNQNIQKHLSTYDSVALVVGLVVGIGIFQVSPTVAGSSGNELAFYGIWILGALLSLAGIFCYAELASTYQANGGDYFFLRNAYGKTVGFSYGWAQMILIRPGSIAAVSFPFATYSKALYPELLGNISKLLICSVAILILTLVNIIKAGLGSAVQRVFSTLAYLLLIGIAVIGITVSNESSVFVTDSPDTNYGLALILVLFCYGGWSELALVAGEVIKPRTKILISLVCGLILILFVYLLVNYAYVKTLGFSGLVNSDAPAVALMPEKWQILVAGAIVLCCLSSLNALILAGARISHALGEDFDHFAKLGEWDEKRNSPVYALSIQAILSVLFVILAGSFEKVLVYTTAVVWLYYMLVGISLFIFRYKDKNVERPYKVWLYPITPLVFCGSCLFLIISGINYDLAGTLITFGIIVVGIIYYSFFKKRT